MRVPSLFLSLSVLLSCGGPMPEDAADMGPASVVAGSRLTPLYFRGSDGSRVPSIWFLDKKTGRRCALNVYEGAGAPADVFCATSPGAAPDADSVHFTLAP